jgi:hypothetical protein
MRRSTLCTCSMMVNPFPNDCRSPSSPASSSSTSFAANFSTCRNPSHNSASHRRRSRMCGGRGELCSHMGSSTQRNRTTQQEITASENLLLPATCSSRSQKNQTSTSKAAIAATDEEKVAELVQIAVLNVSEIPGRDSPQPGGFQARGGACRNCR